MVFNIAPFIEAAFVKRDSKEDHLGWKDTSTPSNFIFESSFGFLRLSKRHAFPQTFAYIKGDVLYFGYGDQEQGKAAADMPLHHVSESSFYGTEFLYASVDIRQGKVCLQRDAFSTLPIVTAMNANRLYKLGICNSSGWSLF